MNRPLKQSEIKLILKTIRQYGNGPEVGDPYIRKLFKNCSHTVEAIFNLLSNEATDKDLQILKEEGISY